MPRRALPLLVLAALVAALWCGDPASAAPASRRCKRLCRADVRACTAERCAGQGAAARRACRRGCRSELLGACRAQADPTSCRPSDPAGGWAGTLFESPVPWTADVSGLAKSGHSDRIIAGLAAAGGWGTGTMRIDFSIEVLEAGAATPFRDFTPTDDFYEPDCDHVPFPVPPGGALEGEDGYRCTQDGDCHLIVVHPPSKRLFEMWRADDAEGSFRGGCAVVWDLARTWPDSLRGDGCTSADAAGLPIAALLFGPDEVAAGEVAHAVRFILPNDRIRHRTYVRPATHATGAASGGDDLPPYGTRLRLRADFPLESLPNDAARVIARALQRYGMFLADGGQIALTGQSDRFTTAKWADLGVDSRALAAIAVTDMEVVDFGDPIAWTGDCVRNP